MPIVVNEDGTVTVTGEEAQSIVNGLAQQVSTDPVAVAVPNNDIEQIIVLDSPEASQTSPDGVEIIVQGVSDSVIDELYIVNHNSLLNLNNVGNDDHPQYDNDFSW